jgi:hypothetical protein
MAADLEASALPSRAQPPDSSRVGFRSVAIPSEHGGWSLTAEPVMLGLLVAWSWPGLALGLAAMIAFVARTPLKLVLVDLWRHRWLHRTVLAARIAAVELVVLGALVTYAALTADLGLWLPLVVALPLIVLELWYDMRSKSRRLIPELAGSVGIGAVAAAIALAGRAPDRVAWGLWFVVAVRSLAAIPYVRTQISRAKSRNHPRWFSDFAQVVAGVAVIAVAAVDLVPVASAAIICIIAAANIVAVRIAPRRAVLIGIEQTLHGVAVIGTTALAIQFG